MPAGTVSSRARLSIIAALLVCAFVTPSSVTMRAEPQNARKLGPLAAERAARGTGRSTVIISAANRDQMMDKTRQPSVSGKSAKRPTTRGSRNNQVTSGRDLQIGQTKNVFLQANTMIEILNR